MRKTLFALTILLLIAPALAANDPGHDPLYIEQEGNSTLTGNLNISEDLRVAQRIYSDYLEVRGDGAVSGTNRIIGKSGYLQIEAAGGAGIVYLFKDAAGEVRVGTPSQQTTLNVSGTIYQDNKQVCLSDGTNCISGTNSGNVSSIIGGNGISVNQATGDVTLSTDAPTCGAGEYARWTGSAWVCSTPASGTDNQTLQEVTDQGTTTTDAVTIDSNGDETTTIGGTLNSGIITQTGIATDTIAIGGGHGALGAESVVIGVDAEAYQASSPDRHTVIGNEAGKDNTAQQLTAVGYHAGNLNQGINLVAVGNYAGKNNTGSSITTVGYNSGQNNKGTLSTLIGNSAGYNNDGNRILATGYRTGYENTGDNSVFIGYRAGENNAQNNQLIIHHDEADLDSTPLIQGNFNTEELTIDGDLNVTTGNDICIDGGNCLSTAGADENTVEGYIYDNDNNLTGPWTVSASSTNDINFDSNTFVVDVSEDRVGIGTSSPEQPLHIIGDSATIYAQSTNPAQYTGYEIYDQDGTLAASIQYANNETGFSPGSMFLGPRKAGENLSFITNPTTERMRLTSDGNLGIGTTSPETALDVKGNIKGDAIEYADETTQISAATEDGIGWHIGTTKFKQNISAQDATANDIFFTPDGKTMYEQGRIAQGYYEYSCTTAWDISSCTSSGSTVLASQSSGAQGMFFKPDGKKLYETDNLEEIIYEYECSTAWNISSCSQTSLLSASALDIYFKPDGKKLYTADSISNLIREYSCGTAWDISSCTYSTNIASQDTTPEGITFKPDGKKLYETGSGSDKIYEYECGTPWDITTCSYTTSINLEGSGPGGVYIKPDGTKIYVSDWSTDSLYEYDIGIAIQGNVGIGTTNPQFQFNVEGETAGLNLIRTGGGDAFVRLGNGTNHSQIRYDANTQGDIYFTTKDSANEQMRITTEGNVGIGTTSPSNKLDVDGTIRANNYNFLDGSTQYMASTPDGRGWNLRTATYNSVSISTQDSNPRGMAFKQDGTKIYEIGFNADKIYQYTCTTAWDLSSCSYDSININTQDSSPTGIAISPNGKKIYEIGNNADKIYQYSCSTPWDLSSCSYDNINISTQDSKPLDLAIKPDGTKIYIVGSLGDKIYQYSCSTPWDLSSCSYDNINIPAHGGVTAGLAVSPDGREIYQSGTSTNAIRQISCTTPWDLSSCSWAPNYITLGTQDSLPYGLAVSPDGTKIYEIGAGTGKIYEWDLGVIIQGKVGIGLSNPLYDLDINGEVAARGSDGFRLRGSSYSTIFRNDGNDFWILQTAASNQDGTWNSFRPFNLDFATGDVSIQNGNIFADQSSGDVGIGNTAPDYKLHISDATAPTLTIDPAASTTADPMLYLKDTGSVNGFQLWYDNNVGSTYFDNKYNNDAGDMHFRTKTDGTAVDAMTIEGSGRIGIGTTSPQAELHVNGSLRVENDCGIPGTMLTFERGTVASSQYLALGNGQTPTGAPQACGGTVTAISAMASGAADGSNYVAVEVMKNGASQTCDTGNVNSLNTAFTTTGCSVSFSAGDIIGCRTKTETGSVSELVCSIWIRYD